MAQPGDTETDDLASVIDAIQLGRKTGVLTVRRGDIMKQEEGFIVFINGHPARASMGRLNTQEALRWLATWRICRFNFVASLPPYLDAAPNPLSPSGERSPALRDPVTPLSPTGPIPSGTYTRPESGSITPGLRAAYEAVHRVCGVDEGLYRIDRSGFSRTHRRLFLLIDGRRTLHELAQLLGRSASEVQEMVIQLAQRGLVQ